MKYPFVKSDLIDKNLEKEMEDVQGLVSTVHSLRKNNNIKVRQPLSKIILFSDNNIDFIYKFEDLVLSETNIKQLVISNNFTGVFKYKIKPNFKILGKKYGKFMNDISNEINNFDDSKVNNLKADKKILLNCGIEISIDDCIFDLVPDKNICVDNYKNIIVAIDNNITDELKKECIARDFINLIQNYRKSNSFNIEDKIEISLFSEDNYILEAIKDNIQLIKTPLLCEKLEISQNYKNYKKLSLNDVEIFISINVLN